MEASQEPMEKKSPKEKEISEDGKTGVSSSSPCPPVVADLKQPAKKPTRQWAAWTRQEEENFFNALRQVGKNFEKITSRVHSKNKDQVRHYYYRLVRRMKKLLGPGFGLDAKNSKDTIAAMLRWWSLLEKYSCAASKLHLKPRRFKTFIEALAHQLLKDRNKTRRKQSNHEEPCCFTSSSSSIMTKGPGSDIDPVKFLFLESQKNHKLGYSKKSSLRGSSSVDINCSRGGFSVVKSMKQNRRTGLIASAAYKRWEKAALAGVSLVADAAEQLERTMNDKVDSSNQATNNQPLEDHVEEDNAGSTANPMPCSPSEGTLSHLSQSFIQPLMKLKLQLFPVDEFTRRALEKDHHNPYLELTLSVRKRISSILEHLNCKWGKSSVALGELALLPYDIQVENLINCKKWTVRDRTACAADVYQIVGRPEVFRLRYGWLPNSVPELRSFQLSEDVVGKIAPTAQARSSDVQENLSPIVGNGIPSSNGMADVAVISMKPNYIYQDSLQPISTSCLQQSEETKSEKKQGNSEDNELLNNLSSFSAGEWADSLTNISIGDLLSEASRTADSSNDHRPCIVSFPPVKNNTLSCDSFDAAHLFGYKDQQSTSNRMSQASLWDGEETCDEFSFKKISSKMSYKNQEDLNALYKVPDKPCNQINYSDTVGFSGLLKDTDRTEPKPNDICKRGMKVDSDHTEGVSHETFDTQNAFALADIYWPDSLSAFDLGIPSFPRYWSQDLTFGDHISQNALLGRLIENSADAFQNLSFSAPEKTAQSARDGEEAMSHSSQVKSEECYLANLDVQDSITP